MNVLKDPAAILDYCFDWSDWLAGDSDTIASHTVTVDAGITLDSDSATTTKVTAWVSGGTGGNSYKLTCRIVTAQARTDERHMILHVQER